MKVRSIRADRSSLWSLGSLWSLASLLILLLGCTGGDQAPSQRPDPQVVATPTPEPTPTPRPPETLELEGGITVEVRHWGTGPTPQNADSVRLHYVLRDNQGEVLDDSRERDGIHEVALDDSAAVPGLAVALRSLPAGSRGTITLPPGSAFADLGYADIIPPGATLTMEVEVLEIVPQP